MRIFHVSDSHGNLHDLSLAHGSGADVVVLTGDMLPNFFPYMGIENEKEYQTKWFQGKSEHFLRYLGGKPVVVVNGNHDFVCLAELLTRAGYQGEVHKLDETKAVELLGYRWGGHGYIPYISGCWNDELRSVDLAVKADTLFSQPGGVEILCTHTPAKGFLSGPWGCSSLASNLLYNPCAESVRLHLFGHVHQEGGTSISVGTTQFYNSATTHQVIEMP